jgi:NCS2 family nucleobase:cation symporter-2
MPVRPADLTYGVDDLPPWPRLLFLGGQHAALMSVYLVLIVIVFRHAGADQATIANALSLGMIGLAVATVLQALWRGPVGSGYLAAPVFSAMYLGPCLLAAKVGGLPAVFGMTVFAGLVEAALALSVTRLRSLFPPAVSGFIVLVVGIELGLIGVRDLLAVDLRQQPDFAASLAVAWFTLAVMVALSVWGGGFVRLLCSTMGLIVGIAAAAWAGLIPASEWAEFRSGPLFALPRLDFLSYAFVPELIPGFAIAACAGMLRSVGVITTCQKINDAEWKRPDLASIRGGGVADGLGCAVCGLVGSIGVSTAPSLVGVSHASGATSRNIAFACAAILLVAALVPAYARFFVLLPQPVLGAAVTFTASLVIASGLQIIMSRNLDMRTTFVVGIALLVAIGRGVFPDYFSTLPPLLRSAAGSMLTVGAVTALLLNLVFRIGATRRIVVEFEAAAGSLDQFAQSLRERAKGWAVSAELVERAIASSRALIGQIEDARLIRGRSRASVSCNETSLTVTVEYEGEPVTLPGVRAHSGFLLRRLAFSHSLAEVLGGVHADRMAGRVHGKDVVIELIFDA